MNSANPAVASAALAADPGAADPAAAARRGRAAALRHIDRAAAILAEGGGPSSEAMWSAVQILRSVARSAADMAALDIVALEQRARVRDLYDALGRVSPAAIEVVRRAANVVIRAAGVPSGNSWDKFRSAMARVVSILGFLLEIGYAGVGELILQFQVACGLQTETIEVPAELRRWVAGLDRAALGHPRRAQLAVPLRMLCASLAVAAVRDCHPADLDLVINRVASAGALDHLTKTLQLCVRLLPPQGRMPVPATCLEAALAAAPAAV